MLKLIYGVSGSGKTDLLTEAIKSDIQNQKRCFLLVPEQQAYISEFEVPRCLPPDARLYFEVVHFSGLADNVFRKFGGAAQDSLPNGIRTLLMWDTMRTLAPILKEYKKNAARDFSLTSLVMQTVNELRMNGMTPSQLEEIADRLPPEHPLQNKLYDIAALDSAYTQRLEDCMGSDLPDCMLRLAQTLEENNYFSGCNVYIDSFTSFTMQEYRVLRQILKQADQVTVSLCFDAFSSKLPHFATTTDTAIRLLHMASDLNLPVKKQALLPKNAEKSRVLASLERDLWRFDVREDERVQFTSEEQSAIRMIKCPNLYEEAEAAVLQILDLVRSGIRFGEIAIVVRDIENYRGVLDAALERYSIPFFMSERTDLSSKPISRLILSALRAISHHYSTQDIMTLVKTGLAGVDFHDASMFEEYCETWHIRGSRFLDDIWSMNPDGLTTERSERGNTILSAANRTRKTVMLPLQRLAAAMKESSLVSDRCRAVYQYLCDLSVAEQLAGRAKQEIEKGLRREAGETLRLYRFVTDSLTTLCNALPDSEMTLEEFFMALTLLFSESDLGSVPNTHDCVIIGSANTLRVEKIRAGLLLGLCEGEFPLAVSDHGLLTEQDKTLLEEEFGVILASRERVRSSEELLYIYRAMTKPTEKLILSTVTAQSDGSAKTPSLAFTRVAFLLNRTKKDFESFDMAKVKALLGVGPSEIDASHWNLPKNQQPITLRLSHTKLQSFLQCPYKYYSTYRLKLREPKDSRPSYLDDGLFLHYVFENFLRESLGEDGKLRVPQEDRIEPLADAIIEKYLETVCPIDQASADRHLLHLFARLRTLALIILRNILAELKVSGFTPYRFEEKIGSSENRRIPAPTWVLQDGSRVIFTGTVDRIDLYDDGENLYLRVVDYKSGKHEFKLDDVCSGLDVQLVLYLFAALAPERKALPAGALYLYAKTEKGKLTIQRSGFYVDIPPVKEAWEQEKGSFTRGLKAQTVQEVQALEQSMQSAIVSAAERILSGEAQKTPSEDACRFCPVRTVCDKAYHK